MFGMLARQSTIVYTYVIILAGVLAGAGIVLSWLGRTRNVKPIWATYRSWLVMAPIGLAAVFFGRVPIIVLFVMLSIFAFKEFSRATGLYKDWWMTGAVYLGIIALGISAVRHDPRTGLAGRFDLFMSLPIFTTVLILFIPIVRNRAKDQLQAMALSVFGYLLIGWMFLHLIFLADRPETIGLLLYLVVAVELNDVAAFTIGRLVGSSRKHPFRSVISPNKTWEGALGALAISMILPWALRFSFPQFTGLQLVLTGVIIGVGGQLGDLSISVIKRDLGLKDMGALIPGHGGVLDRIDSLIITAPLFVQMVNHFYHYW